MSGGSVDQAQIDQVRAASDAVVVARREAAAAAARLAAAAVRYADLRTALDLTGADREETGRAGRARPGEFVADELAVVLREQPWPVRCLLARTRRGAAGLPAVWQAHQAGDLDAEQVRVIDRAARRATHAATIAALDEQAVDAAQTRGPKQLTGWALRLIVALEPGAFAARHRRALADRGVRVVQGPDGTGYVTGEVTAADAAQIDALLTTAARSLGAADPRNQQQRRADLFADLLLGRLDLTQPDDSDSPDHTVTADGSDSTSDSDTAASHPDQNEPGPQPDHADGAAGAADADSAAGAGCAAGTSVDHGAGDGWLEVETIDPDTGELLGTTWRRTGPDGEPLHPDTDNDPGQPNRPGGQDPGDPARRRPLVPSFRRRPTRLRIGVVVPLSSLLGLTDTPGQLPDRSSAVPADTLRDLIAATGESDGTSRGLEEVLFTRLLTDDSGRLLDTTELGRAPSRRLAEAIRLRAGTCRFPTCTVPAEHCDLDHHEPHPRGPTHAANLDPGCRRHHRGKTHAWLATHRDHYGVDWTMPDAHTYRCHDEPLPTGLDP